MSTSATTVTTHTNNQIAAFPRTPEAHQKGNWQDNFDFRSDDEIISQALRILESRARYGESLSSPSAAGDFCRLKIGALEHEVFGVLFLDAQNRLIEYQEMFRGTLTQTSVYPREAVKAALATNAAAVIMTHNHPSGSPDPSRADELLTGTLKNALALIDVRVLDHLIVCVDKTTSMAEKGII